MLNGYLNVVTGNYLSQMEEVKARRSLNFTDWERYLNGPSSEIKSQNYATSYYKKDIVQI